LANHILPIVRAQDFGRVCTDPGFCLFDGKIIEKLGLIG